MSTGQGPGQGPTSDRFHLTFPCKHCKGTHEVSGKTAGAVFEEMTEFSAACAKSRRVPLAVSLARRADQLMSGQVVNG